MDDATFRSEGMAAQGSEIRVQLLSVAGTSIPITTMENTNPAVVTFTSPPADVGEGSVLLFDGTSEANVDGKTFALGANVGTVPLPKYEVLGLDGTGWATSVAAGTATPNTYANACEAKDFTFAGGTSNEIEKTTLCSQAKEFVLGLQDNGNFNFNMNYKMSDPAQQELMTARADRMPRWFELEYPDMSKSVFQAYVKEFNRSGAQGQIITAAVSTRITGPVTDILPPADAGGTFAVEGEGARQADSEASRSRGRRAAA
jgi:hypothetical protein